MTGASRFLCLATQTLTERLPSPELALSEPDGLLAAGGSLAPEILIEAYQRGIFPWFSDGQPVLWWSPDPRMVLPVAQFKVSRSLRKTLRRFAADPSCEIRIDSAFGDVIRACARAPRKGQDGTWIVPSMVQAYEAWHRQGRVHSVEAWMQGRLAGGLYGVSIGRMFFGESMFALQTDASKIALAALVAFCRHHGIGLIDCQQNTEHLASLGARTCSRQDFERHLQQVTAQPEVGDWAYHLSMWALLNVDEVPAPPQLPSCRRPDPSA